MKKKLIDMGELVEMVLSLQARVDALEQKPRAGRPPDRIKLAVAWLEKLLRKGPVAIPYIFRKGKEEGYTLALMRKAARELCVESDRKTWRLP